MRRSGEVKLPGSGGGRPQRLADVASSRIRCIADFEERSAKSRSGSIRARRSRCASARNGHIPVAEADAQERAVLQAVAGWYPRPPSFHPTGLLKSLYGETP